MGFTGSIKLASCFLKFHRYVLFWLIKLPISSGSIVNMFSVDGSKSWWPTCPWNCSYVQDWPVQVWGYCSQLDTEVCHGMMGRTSSIYVVAPGFSVDLGKMNGRINSCLCFQEWQIVMTRFVNLNLKTLERVATVMILARFCYI